MENTIEKPKYIARENNVQISYFSNNKRLVLQKSFPSKRGYTTKKIYMDFIELKKCKIVIDKIIEELKKDNLIE